MKKPAPILPTGTKTPVAPKTNTTSTTPIIPTMGGIIKTPVAPRLETTTRTPVQQKGPTIDRGSIQPTLPGISGTGPGMPLKITDKGHKPLPQTIRGEILPTLYHGSDKPIPRKEVVKAGGPMSKQFAFATYDPATAGLYAQDRNKYRAEQPGLWSVVSEVEAINPKTTYRDVTEHGKNTGSYISPEGFVSKGPSHLVDIKGVMSPTKPNSPAPWVSSSRPELTVPLRRSEEFKQGTLFTAEQGGRRMKSE